jgi:hypothetical protein
VPACTAVTPSLFLVTGQLLIDLATGAIIASTGTVHKYSKIRSCRLELGESIHAKSGHDRLHVTPVSRPCTLVAPDRVKTKNRFEFHVAKGLAE